MSAPSADMNRKSSFFRSSPDSAGFSNSENRYSFSSAESSSALSNSAFRRSRSGLEAASHVPLFFRSDAASTDIVTNESAGSTFR